MPRKAKPDSDAASAADNAHPHANLRDSARQIWMAGLSAFAKAQAGGNKVFEALMKEGETLQSQTRQAAREQVDEIAARASGTWDKLEQVFETRVARALHSLGVPTHDDIDRLSRRVAELSSLVEGLAAQDGATAAKAGPPKASQPKTPRKSPGKVARKVASKTTPARTASKARKASTGTRKPLGGTGKAAR